MAGYEIDWIMLLAIAGAAAVGFLIGERFAKVLAATQNVADNLSAATKAASLSLKTASVRLSSHQLTAIACAFAGFLALVVHVFSNRYIPMENSNMVLDRITGEVCNLNKCFKRPVDDWISE